MTFPDLYLSAYEGPEAQNHPQMLGDGPEGQSLPAGAITCKSQAVSTQTVTPPNSPQSDIAKQTKLACSYSVEPTRAITSISLYQTSSAVWQKNLTKRT